MWKQSAERDEDRKGTELKKSISIKVRSEDEDTSG